MKLMFAALFVLPLAACTDAAMREAFGLPPPAAPGGAVVEAPISAPPTFDATPPPPPPASANSAEAFDTTSADDRAAALAPPPAAGEVRLGTTIAALGAPADPGIWIETGLVSELTWGRAEVAATGKTITVELRPSGSEAGSGSQISLPAMRLLDIPLTALPELVLYRLPGGAPG